MLLLASFIIFMLFAKTPGDFIDGNITLTAVRAAELKAIYGLDQPLLTRYLHWLGQLLRGDLGFSLQYQIPVSQLLNQYIWNSFLLASVALVFYWGIGLAVGVVSALRPGSWFDHLVSVAVFAAMSFPTFFLCLLLIKWFAVDLHWLPVGGMTNTGSDESGWQYVLQVAAHLALPVLALVMLQAGSLTRYVRASMLDVVKMDFIRTARAKGLQERTVILKHALRNALQGYRKLNVKAFEKIKPGGILFTFSCSQAVSKENFRTAVFTAAAMSGRSVRILHQLTQPADHPVSIYHPEGEYLKGLVLYVE